jgi:hypothetical protein
MGTKFVQTIDSVIPVLTSHLRSKYTKRSALQIGKQRPLFLSDVMLSGLQRRNRTSIYLSTQLLPYRLIVEQGLRLVCRRKELLNGLYSFFMHLISILGPSDFLNPVCILLLERVTSSDGQKKRHTEKSSLAAAIMQSRPLEARLVV